METSECISLMEQAFPYNCPVFSCVYKFNLLSFLFKSFLMPKT